MRGLAVGLVVILGLVLAACGGGNDAAPPSTGFNLPAFGLRVDAVPATLVRVDSGTELVPVEPSRGGRISLEVWSPDSGVNLIEAIRRHQDEIESRTQGSYFGAQELVTPLGTAFWSRGRWRTSDQEELEETIALALHPDRARILSLRYRYPAGDDSSDRVTELLELLASVEGLEPPAEG